MIRSLALCLLFSPMLVSADELPVREVDGQPLAANAKRLVEALQYLGSPLPTTTETELLAATKRHDAKAIQQILDAQVAFGVSVESDSSLKLMRGKAKLTLQQAGFTSVLVKILNPHEVEARLVITSPQAGPVYAGVHPLSMRRQQQQGLRVNQNVDAKDDRFLAVEMFESPPLARRLSGLEVEYAVALLYSSISGQQRAEIGFELAEKATSNRLPIQFEIRPAVPVSLTVRDADGTATMAKLLFRDAAGRVYPPQPKRLAPDFFFQPHIYRADGETVLLPPGRFFMHYSRGPEYHVLEQEVTVKNRQDAAIRVDLKRWIDSEKHGFFSGDHHIHAAGCAHYTIPTQGVTPEDMFRQVKGEGLNVGCVLTWGPCFDHQRNFFAPSAAEISEPRTVLKYDLEISGFGSQRLGHVCLLNLKDQTYPGSEGTSTKGWPTWTTPVMRWAKQQGGVTGYAHSASGLMITPGAAAQRLLAKGDRDGNALLSQGEAKSQLLPEAFAASDTNSDGQLDEQELTASHDRVADELPNLAIPEMNGVGAMEICVSTAEGVCDFISAMDTARIQEWNCWYHLLNCGFPLKVSGETDFPCMSSRRVGQGRVYVQLGEPKQVDFPEWCAALAAGRSYVSDGFAHAVDFRVANQRPGFGDVRLDNPDKIKVTAQVAFAREQPLAVAYGGVTPDSGRRLVGDTILLHGPRDRRSQVGGERLVELIVNGQVVAAIPVPADGAIHDLEFEVAVDRSSWIALRQFPQLHTNPVNVIVQDQPIRVSRKSALWCIETIELLWKNRGARIAENERAEAEAAFQRAIEVYRRIAAEADEHVEGYGAVMNEQGFRIHTLHSKLQRGPTKVRVLLPDRIEDQKQYRAVYVLPVEAGDGRHYGDGLEEIKRLGLHNELGVICVAPTFADLPWYADHPTDLLIRQESYFVNEVVPFVQTNYPVASEPNGRLLVGFSKSGWGAFSLLLRHPEKFGKAAAWDAPLTMSRYGRFGSRPIFGTQDNFELYQVTRLLSKRAAELTQEPRLIHLGYGNFREHHEAIEELLDELQIRHIYHDGPHRKHVWGSGWLAEAMRALAADQVE
jgi:hypothetical protein